MTLNDYVQVYLCQGDRGGFAAALAKAWCVADSGNRAKLEAAFPHLFRVPEHLQ